MITQRQFCFLIFFKFIILYESFRVRWKTKVLQLFCCLFDFVFLKQVLIITVLLLLVPLVTAWTQSTTRSNCCRFSKMSTIKAVYMNLLSIQSIKMLFYIYYGWVIVYIYFDTFLLKTVHMLISLFFLWTLRPDRTEVLSEGLQEAEKRIDQIKVTCESTAKKVQACLQGQGKDGVSIDKRIVSPIIHPACLGE